MGDAEKYGTGVEIAGEMTVRLELLKGKQGEWPVSETWMRCFAAVAGGVKRPSRARWLSSNLSMSCTIPMKALWTLTENCASTGVARRFLHQ